jgi:hypothetical protein
MAVLTNAKIKPLFDLSLMDIAGNSDEFPFECNECNNTFYATKRLYKGTLSERCNTNLFFCSMKCFYDRQKSTRIIFECANCKTPVIRVASQLKRQKKPNSFCSSSCAATYNNLHKITGNRRSKLEIWLEEKLPNLYPDLLFEFNNKQAINSELDIYIPSLKLAFELNGIYHYEPIHGADKFEQIQNNDHRKFQACLEQKIELCIIDSSGLKYNKPEKFIKYLDIIVNIIKQRTT